MFINFKLIFIFMYSRMKGETKGERPRKLEVEKKYVKVRNKTKNNVKSKYNCDMRGAEESDCLCCKMKKEMKHFRTRKEFTKTEESLKKKNKKLSQHKDMFKK